MSIDITAYFHSYEAQTIVAKYFVSQSMFAGFLSAFAKPAEGRHSDSGPRMEAIFNQTIIDIDPPTGVRNSTIPSNQCKNDTENTSHLKVITTVFCISTGRF